MGYIPIPLYASSRGKWLPHQAFDFQWTQEDSFVRQPSWGLPPLDSCFFLAKKTWPDLIIFWWNHRSSVSSFDVFFVWNPNQIFPWVNMICMIKWWHNLSTWLGFWPTGDVVTTNPLTAGTEKPYAWDALIVSWRWETLRQNLLGRNSGNVLRREAATNRNTVYPCFLKPKKR